jgi:hypothetical protein
MTNVYLDIKTQFVPHRKHITSPPQRSAGDYEEPRLLGCYAVWLYSDYNSSPDCHFMLDR